MKKSLRQRFVLFDYLCVLCGKSFFLLVVLNLLLLGLCIGCSKPQAGDTANITKPPEKQEPEAIGRLVRIIIPPPTPVEGYALVGGLNGTGSSQCPPDVRQYLEQYILKQLPKQNVSRIINSPDTAVVRISGTIPAIAPKNQHFDLKVAALPGTQTTSLDNGILWKAELKPKGRFSIGSKTLAFAEGPVFIDSLNGSPPDKRQAFILAGGTSLNDYTISIALQQPGYRLSRAICDRINERFGSGSAMAIMPGQIDMSIPEKYKGREEKFCALVKATYLFETPQLTQQRIEKYINDLSNLQNTEQSETVLEAIGVASAEKLAALLDSQSEPVRLSAARCLLNIGDDRGLEPLRLLAYDAKSSIRIDALTAIAFAARRNDASEILQRLLRDNDFNIRLAAYEQLCRLDDIAVSREIVGRNFFLDQLTEPSKQSIYVTRSGQPKIVLFGAPIYCREGTFIQTKNGSITINAPGGSDTVQVIRKEPSLPPMKLDTSYKLSDIIKTLCEESVLDEKSPKRPGLNFSYADMIAVVKQLCDKGAVLADFHASDTPKID